MTVDLRQRCVRRPNFNSHAAVRTLRQYLVSRLCEVFVERKRDFDLALLHQGKRDAIGQGISFVAMAFQQTPTMQKQPLVHVHDLDRGAGEEEASNLHSLGVMSTRIKVCDNFV